MNIDHAKSEKKQITENRRICGISDKRVINRDYLKSLGEIYKCNICFQVMINPTDCESCGHSYCLECITNLRCPYNCESNKIKSSSMGIKVLLNQITFHCENEECDEKLNLSNILRHDQECEYKLIKCPTAKCNKSIPKRLMERHIKEECQFVSQICKICSNEFLKCELEEHLEHCEYVHNSLKSDLNISEKIPLNIRGSRFLEALNFNIGKIVKDNESKYKNLEDENNKIKNDFNLNLQTIFDSLKNEFKQSLSSEIKEIKKEIHVIKDEESSTENNSRNMEIKLIDNLNEILKSSFEDLFSSKIKNCIEENSRIIQECLTNFQNSIKEKNLDENPIEKVAEFKKLMNHALNDMEDNINLRLTENNRIIINEITDETKKIKNISDLLIEYKTNDKESQIGMINKINSMSDKLLSINKIVSEISLNQAKDLFNNSENNFSKKEAQIPDESEYNIDYERVTEALVKNVIEIVKENNNIFKEFLESEIKCQNIEIHKKIDKLLEEVENINENLNNVASQTKEIKVILSEEFYDLRSNIVNDISSNNMIIGENITKEINQYTNKIDLKQKDLVLTELKEKEKEILGKLTKLENVVTTVNTVTSNQAIQQTANVDQQLKDLELNILNKIDFKLKEMYNLKWCNQCEKVDYFFGFIKCEICNKENCKQCVMLCKKCKHLYCNNCVRCPRCQDLSCLKCRECCSFCSLSVGTKFCEACMKQCIYCNKSSCQDCIKQCQQCKNVACIECSKFCRICNKSSCWKCVSTSIYKTCYNCHETSCIECIVTCKSCDLEICSTCFLACKRCKNVLCKKCVSNCAMCNDSYCPSCAKEFQHNKCFICKNTLCTGCIKNFRKCKTCKEAACKNCHSQCRKCKNYFCLSCNLNCDNCNEYTCSSCVYKCSCDLVIFCEKCLLDVHPIGPHNCVLWMNDSTDFTGIKSRSKLELPKNFEVKLYLEKFDSENLLIGVTDNNLFNEDSLTFVDNIWAFKLKTGQKYSTKKFLEPYYEKDTREKDFIIVAVKNDNLYFRVNFDDNPPAYTLPKHRSYFLYIENDSTNGFSNVKVKFVYIRKI